MLPNGRAWSQSPGPHSHSSTSHCLFMPCCLYCVHQCFSNVMRLYNTWESYKMQILIQYLCDETWGSVFPPGFQMMPMNQVITFLPHLLTEPDIWYHSKRVSLNVLQEVFTLPMSNITGIYRILHVWAFSEERICSSSSHSPWTLETK